MLPKVQSAVFNNINNTVFACIIFRDDTCKYSVICMYHFSRAIEKGHVWNLLLEWLLFKFWLLDCAFSRKLLVRLNSNREIFVLPVYYSSRCQVRLNERETKFSSWHGNKIARGHRPDGNAVLISFQHSVIGWLFPQNNIQQVFQRLHALLQEEYSGEDLQIIACPSMEQVQHCGISTA